MQRNTSISLSSARADELSLSERKSAGRRERTKLIILRKCARNNNWRMISTRGARTNCQFTTLTRRSARSVDPDARTARLVSSRDSRDFHLHSAESNSGPRPGFISAASQDTDDNPWPVIFHRARRKEREALARDFRGRWRSVTAHNCEMLIG